MPPPNYNLGKIYKISCLATGKQFIGATTKAQLASRLAELKLNYRKFLDGRIKFKSPVFDVLEGENCVIELIEECPCESKNQLNTRLVHHIKQNECINKVIPTLLPKNEAAKKYREENKKEIAQKKKEYRTTKVQCECGCLMTHGHESEHRRTNKHINLLKKKQGETV